MKRPPYVREGDNVGIIAPAGIVDQQEIEPAISILREWGLIVVLGKYLYARYRFFAGTDKQRLHDFQEMLDNPLIKVIFCARGGYGTIRILNDLDFTKFKKNPKWIVGYSDITVIHTFLTQKLNIESLHSIMPKNFKKAQEDKQSLEYLKKALFGESLNYEIPSQKLNKTGKSSGVLTGGNLSIIYNLQATAFEIKTSDKILFVEEVNEYLYHLDRMMMNMKLSGKLAGLKGLIVGGMSEMKNTTPDFGKSANEIIAEAIKDYNYPVLFNFPAGHVYPCLTLFLGRKIDIDVTQKSCKIKFLG